MTHLKDKLVGCIIGGDIGDYIRSLVEGQAGLLDVRIPVSSQTTDDT